MLAVFFPLSENIIPSCQPSAKASLRAHYSNCARCEMGSSLVNGVYAHYINTRT
jgi:hypothetical protein